MTHAELVRVQVFQGLWPRVGDLGSGMQMSPAPNLFSLHLELQSLLFHCVSLYPEL